ncbi:MAG TPA: branched-chain amino acid ABC transporter permease [Bradyrhizobium sp.]|nr:branched-chain amino acid ABC transporter permease [Bradyrhizobium sp.]
MSNPIAFARNLTSTDRTAEHASRLQLLTLALRMLLVVAIMFLAMGPWLFDLNQLTLLTEFYTLLVLALMWNLLAGYADIVTVGQHGFVGVGAYAFFGLAVLSGLDPFLSIILAAAITGMLAVPALLFILRLRLAYLAVGTWVLADVLSLIAGKLPGFGGGSGVSLPISIARAFGGSMSQRIVTLYILTFVLAAAALAATWLLLRSRIGLGLTAMRDSEDGAKSAGVDVPRMRVICFLWTTPFLGLAGALVTLQKVRIAPSASFSITDWTIFIIFVVVIGGIGSLEGPIIGTALFLLLREYLADFGAWYLILLGAVSIGVILIEPRGLWGVWRRFFPIDVIPVSHKGPEVTDSSDFGRNLPIERTHIHRTGTMERT